MRYSHLLAIGLATAVGLFRYCQRSRRLKRLAPYPNPRRQVWNALPQQSDLPTDPFKCKLAGPDFPAGLLPIAEKVRDTIFNSGLPCQENVRPNTGKENVGLENLQRGFDFYSWRTFLALNPPPSATHRTFAGKHAGPMGGYGQFQTAARRYAAGQPAAATMADRQNRMEAERERVIPEECRALDREMPREWS